MLGWECDSNILQVLISNKFATFKKIAIAKILITVAKDLLMCNIIINTFLKYFFKKVFFKILLM